MRKKVGCGDDCFQELEDVGVRKVQVSNCCEIRANLVIAGLFGQELPQSGVY